MYKKKSDNLIMIAKGAGHELCPQTHNADKWGVNDQIIEHPDCDLIFNMHMPEHYSAFHTHQMHTVSNYGIPIMMPDRYKEIKTSIKYPLKEIIRKYKSDYFFTVVPYMIAYAMYLGYKKIDTYGINCTGAWEKYKNAKACVEYWIGRAQGQGIKVTIHGNESEVLRTYNRRLYGYENLMQKVPEKIKQVSFSSSLEVKTMRDLHTLLSAQSDSHYEYNLNPLLITNDRRYLEDSIKYNWDYLMGFSEYKMVGDVGFYNAYNSEYIRGIDHDAKFICLFNENKEETVRSLSEQYEGFNVWTNTKSKSWNGCKRHVDERYFPKYDLPREDAIRMYCDEYYNRSVDIARRFPYNFRVWNKDILYCPEGQEELLNFVGYEEKTLKGDL